MICLLPAGGFQVAAVAHPAANAPHILAENTHDFEPSTRSLGSPGDRIAANTRQAPSAANDADGEGYSRATTRSRAMAGPWIQDQSTSPPPEQGGARIPTAAAFRLSQEAQERATVP